MSLTILERQTVVENTKTLPWLCIILSIILIYNLLTFNRFLPLTEGWFSTYAQLILLGKLPYQDFYLFLPPLYPLTIAGIMTLFGPQLIVLRIFGIFLMLVMTGALYALLARFFKPVIAAFVTVIAMIYYQSGVAHIPYDFTQFVTTYALLSACFFMKYYDANIKTFPEAKFWTKNTWYLVGSGVLGALVFWTKQSNGALINAFLVLGILLATMPHNRKWGLISVLGFGTGAALISATLLLWLISHGLLSDFYQQVVVDAIQAKGSSLSHILFAWLGGVINKNQIYDGFILLFSLGYWRLWIRKSPHFLQNNEEKEAYYFPIFLMLGMLLFIPILFPMLVDSTRRIAQISANNIIAFSFATVLVFIGQYCFNPHKYAHKVMIIMLALGLFFGCGTSAGVTEVGAFLGFALFLGYVLSAKSFFQIGKACFLILSLLLVIFYAEKKYSVPYAWWYIQTPSINGEKSSIDLPRLQGMYLPPDTITILQTVDEIVQRTTTENDTILTFPNIPLFYLIENRFKNIRAVVHWPDFLPDVYALQEARRIQAQPPKVIIYLSLPEIVWSTHEQLFRHGKRSGQRDIIDVLKKLTQNNQYSLAANMPVSSGINLYVWVKN